MPTQRWTRPDSVPVPTVWRRFEGRRKTEDGRTLKFRVQDITPDMYDEAIELMEKFFARDEILNICVRLCEDEVSMKEVRDIWRVLLEKQMSVVALIEEEGKPDRMAGMNILGMSYKDEKFDFTKLKGNAIRTVLEFVVGYVEREMDVYAHYGIDRYMTAMGLSVDTEFRGQGIGLELLKARFDLGRACGISHTVTSFTGMASQTLAHKLDFEILKEVPYSEYKVNGEAIFENKTTKTLKIMGKRII